ncbi:alpha/beta hydrolase family protein [Sphingomonas sp.]|uniref:S9 family peptidase n=1 Tax=Sphingomonas sp. TaxID=28214 RepID=UPI003B3A6BE3
MRKRVRAIYAGAALVINAGYAVAAAPEPQTAKEQATPAQLFGRLAEVDDISLSPDGKSVVYIGPGAGTMTYAVVMDVQTGKFHLAAKQDGKPLNLDSCGWSSNTRIVCTMAGVEFAHDPPLGYTRTVAVDQDGKNPVYLGRRPALEARRILQFDGQIIDWMSGDGTVLMTRDYVPDDTTGSRLGSSGDGLGVDRVDTATGRAATVERPTKTARDYITDGQGTIRIRALYDAQTDGTLTGLTVYMYRPAGERGWKTFSRTKEGTVAFTPIAVDGTRDLAYAVRTLNGRDALYSVALDGSFKEELVSSHPEVDVSRVVTIGRRGRVIGASFTTDRREIEYFDPEYKKLAASLARVLPKTPLIYFLSASADEKKLLIFAESDTDPGRYYIFDKQTRHLDELLQARPALADLTLAPMKSITFKAADGTAIPAYLTLPVGGQTKGLPAIVMPHGGPSYRDSWGFDWLVQFFAQRGYAVLQPEYRGSSGYGDAFYAQNGFRSWQKAMGDIGDAGRWLVKEGIADPSKLAIVGWSYGGYAALQSNVVDPTLFKAIIAVAPVTDLGMVKREAIGYTNSQIVARQIGSGDIVTQGSPARHADRITAPVLMFHGDHDLNVLVAESKAMDAALRKAGKKSELVIFPGLDHQLEDSDARAKMLDQSDRFLRAALHM